MAELDESTLIGEMVIIVEKQKSTAKTISNDEIVEILKEKLKTLSSKEAIKETSKDYREGKENASASKLWYCKWYC